MIASFELGGKLHLCGNGGSAADSLHNAEKLVKSFVKKRPLDIDFVKNVSDMELINNLQGATRYCYC